MQGTILILDGVSTNRIMLKVQLSAAWYHVVQAATLEGVMPLIHRTHPDLIISAMDLPDGDALGLHRMLQAESGTANIPMIAIARQNDRGAKLRALAAGIHDVLCQPCNDVILLARIRSLIRIHGNLGELQRQSASQAVGFDEAPSPFAPAERTASVAVIAQSCGTGAVWRTQLREQVGHRLDLVTCNGLHGLPGQAAPDALIVELSEGAAGLRLLADLRARGLTRNAAVIAVPKLPSTQRAATALDLGADDVLIGGFCAREVALRLETLLRRKARADRYRDSVQAGLRAATRDSMTGLYNRRYALPALGRLLRGPKTPDAGFAVMMVDLDHFKAINDTYGHAAGDAVLIETAHRLRSNLRAQDLIARIGGEEFMVALPNTPREDADRVAARLCRQINAQPFKVGAGNAPILVTASIGVVVGEPENTASGQSDIDRLIAQADKALYDAKHAGRNCYMLQQAG
ncbi:diguanylate cyclase domain-containing protein [Ruegeria hyattellae]|uniref:diguanylate cyclase domain-containing protein n=1 Tax=Ruegeria hyattellae TaxID=3233337 RepID=UPI00355B643D